MRFRSGSDCLAEKLAHADKISFSPVFLHMKNPGHLEQRLWFIPPRHFSLLRVYF